MAIYKAYHDEKGVKTLYHCIKQYSVDMASETITAHLKSYVNKSFRDKDRGSALCAYVISITLPYAEPITLKGLYEAITNGDSDLAGGEEV